LHDDQYSAMPLDASYAGTIINSPVEGNIVAIEADPFGGMRIIVEITQEYYFDNEPNSLTYEMLIGGIADIKIGMGKVTQNDTIAAMTKNTYLSVRCKELDPYLVITSNVLPTKRDDYWWFAPSWLQDEPINLLSFREVSSLTTAGKDICKSNDISETDELTTSTITLANSVC